MLDEVKSKASKFSPRIYWREILAFFMLLIAIFFFRSERKELLNIIPQIRSADPYWIAAGVFLTAVYILLQAGMYRTSFAAIALKLSWINASVLFLKRNLLSIFLPAGGVSALAYSPSQIRKAGYTKAQIHQASGLFGFAGIATVFIAGLPVIGYIALSTGKFKDSWLGLVLVLLIMISLVLVARSVKSKGKVYYWIEKKIPSLIPVINEIFEANVNTRKFTGTISYSLGVELSGMLHIYIAMLALGLHASFVASAAAYIVAVLLMIVSPFMRGLGAVELSMVYVLVQLGYTAPEALSVTILYRVFEFWLPLAVGIFAFAWKGRKLFLRIAPALLTFSLGLINIISVVTPPVHQRLRLLREYIPVTAIRSSNLFVLFIGFSLLLTAAYLFRGLRNAWIVAIALAVLSGIGHLTKALDYEETIAAGITLIVLLSTASQYRIRSNISFIRVGVKTAAISFAAVLIFGYISFYYIDVKHFGINFSWKQSLFHTFNIFLLAKDSTLNPITNFGHEFVTFIRVLGFATWGFLFFTLIKPKHVTGIPDDAAKKKATLLVTEFGNSPVDHFKLSNDKLHYFSQLQEGFIAYRIADGFAVVLDEPVCSEENKTILVTEFEQFCKKRGLKSAWYRVDENGISYFSQLKKQKITIGQEAILEINKFTLEGKDKKSLRNGLNSLQKKGYTVTIQQAPHTIKFILALKKVSDEWLEVFDKEEMIFSQGTFDEDELQKQDIITVTDEVGIVQAFLNIIPDYAEDECTYDLIRKTADAPGASMDALIIKLIEYAKEKKLLFLNLGMVAMIGITEPDNTAEQIIKLAAEKIKRFQHYKGLREFKEKYASIWENKYLVYQNDFDLVQLPAVLNKIMKP